MMYSLIDFYTLNPAEFPPLTTSLKNVHELSHKLFTIVQLFLKLTHLILTLSKIIPQQTCQIFLFQKYFPRLPSRLFVYLNHILLLECLFTNAPRLCLLNYFPTNNLYSKSWTSLQKPLQTFLLYSSLIYPLEFILILDMFRLNIMPPSTKVTLLVHP